MTERASLTFATKPVLVGERVLLRPFAAEDVEVMAEILRDPEVNRLTGSVHSSAQAHDPDLDVERLREWYTTRGEREALRFDDAWVDSVLMSVLAPEWRARRAP